ncbi:gastrula zinc finger protein XlCGF8.2DB-like [Pimephales promelas]|nr:gastrula zinc finger protein XlCGF8.2DB-like [Pimephales promelas]
MAPLEQLHRFTTIGQEELNKLPLKLLNAPVGLDSLLDKGAYGWVAESSGYGEFVRWWFSITDSRIMEIIMNISYANYFPSAFLLLSRDACPEKNDVRQVQFCIQPLTAISDAPMPVMRRPAPVKRRLNAGDIRTFILVCGVTSYGCVFSFYASVGNLVEERVSKQRKNSWRSNCDTVIKMAFIKEESGDVKIEETFSVKQEETEEQTGLMPLKEESEILNEMEEKDQYERNNAFKAREEKSFSSSQTGKTYSRKGAKKTGAGFIFTCFECGMGFNQPEDLRVHLRIHNGEMPLKDESEVLMEMEEKHNALITREMPLKEEGEILNEMEEKDQKQELDFFSPAWSVERVSINPKTSEST